MTIYMDAYEHYLDYGEKLFTDTEYIVIEKENVRTGEKSYRLVSDISEGISGNMDASEKRYHGWRGTTNDVQSTALGVMRITNMIPLKNGKNRITLSKDLHPEWA